MDHIRARRSIRRYENRPVAPEKVDLLIEALLRSPTSRNLRCWEFVVIDDEETIRDLSKMKPQGASFLAGAPLAVVILGDPAVSDVWVEDCSIAAILLQLAAVSLDLGSCWIQVRGRPHDEAASAEEFVRGRLGIPDSLKVLAVVAVGHPAEAKDPVPEGDLPRAKVHRNRYPTA